ncbi:prophage antirepressor [Enterococcus faecium]|nr:prophage antirepressor [Enterococcus faecium]MBK4790839.1 prophage antirepressor [Enterococcus faecium]MBK4799148.1 prophage antirepressor [Enterococcus faecium]MBK4820546.1 prophage antirepressor [Enterococcus faecium]
MSQAKQFKRWVTSEVLPTIRKTGSYSNVPQSFAQALRLAADLEEIG